MCRGEMSRYMEEKRWRRRIYGMLMKMRIERMGREKD